MENYFNASLCKWLRCFWVSLFGSLICSVIRVVRCLLCLAAGILSCLPDRNVIIQMTVCYFHCFLRSFTSSCYQGSDITTTSIQTQNHHQTPEQPQMISSLNNIITTYTYFFSLFLCLLATLNRWILYYATNIKGPNSKHLDHCSVSLHIVLCTRCLAGVTMNTCTTTSNDTSAAAIEGDRWTDSCF